MYCQSFIYLTTKLRASKIAKNRPGNPSLKPPFIIYLLTNLVSGLNIKNFMELKNVIFVPEF